jgi:farnesyl-diphosphate farnesyltransferase
MLGRSETESLLVRTSRTVALAIPLLPGELRYDVGVAYLMFRVADTLEAAPCWTRSRRLRALAEFSEFLECDDRGSVEQIAGRWTESPPVGNRDYIELIRRLPALLHTLDTLRPRSREAIREHLSRRVDAMQDVVSQCTEEGRLSLSSPEDLRRYCYVAAGIVGELLTTLFKPDIATDPVCRELSLRAVAFGEGLQLVRILKDRNEDLREGRSYYLDSAGSQVLQLARADLERAGQYVEQLRLGGARPGIVAFAELSLLLAQGTLARLGQEGVRMKLTRAEVRQIYDGVRAQVARAEPWRSRTVA